MVTLNFQVDKFISHRHWIQSVQNADCTLQIAKRIQNVEEVKTVDCKPVTKHTLIIIKLLKQFSWSHFTLKHTYCHTIHFEVLFSPHLLIIPSFCFILLSYERNEDHIFIRYFYLMLSSNIVLNLHCIISDCLFYHQIATSPIMSSSYLLVKLLDSSFLSHDITGSILFSLVRAVTAFFLVFFLTARNDYCWLPY